MFKTNIKIAFRNLLKQPIYALLNIFGLALGITVVLLILQYVVFETSFDTFHENADRVYRVAMRSYEKGEAEQTFAFNYPAVAPQMKKDFPEVQEAIRIRNSHLSLFKEQQMIPENGIRFVDEPFFELFSYNFLEGKSENALATPNSIVLTKNLANQFFGNRSAIGEQIEMEWFSGEKQLYEVTAVIENEPPNTHLTYDAFVPYKKYVELTGGPNSNAETSWGWLDFYTYILLKPEVDVKTVEAKLPDFVEQYKGDYRKTSGVEIKFELQPIADINLHSNMGYEFKSNGDYRYVRFMSLLAIFILIIAWINYINLSTARSFDRAKEVGVRKVLGAKQKQLILQFLTETFLLNTLAFLIAFGVFYLMLPYFGTITGRALELTLFDYPQIWLGIAALLLMGTIFAGLYPSFILANFKPIHAIKERLNIRNNLTSTDGLRKGLVVFQFTASIVLIAGSLLLYQQIQYMRQQNLGIDIEQTLILDDNGRRDTTYTGTVASFIMELERQPSIEGVATSYDIPGKEVGSSNYMRWVNSGSEDMKRVRTFGVDHRFMKNYEMELLAGRHFSENQVRDQNAVIINETALRVFGFSDAKQAIGEPITTNGTNRNEIIGVVKDYHQEALKFDFKPIVFDHPPRPWSYYSVKLATNDLQPTIKTIESTWQQHFPNTPIDYFFLDEAFNDQYKADIQFGYMIGLFTFIAICIACLGLFGLSSYSLARRTKEISIRKILGANVVQLMSLLSKDYLRLLIIAGILAIPVSYWLAQKWLQNYAYQITMSWWFFVLPIVLILVIAGLTISVQSIKAIIRNPVESLRNE